MGVVRRGLLRRFGLPGIRRGSALPSALVHAAVELPGPEGATLRGIFLPAATTAAASTGTALVLHGWGSSALDLLPLAAPLQDCGLDVLLVDARGHGRSDDTIFMSMPRFADDARAALAWLRTQRGVPPQRLVLVGHSVGAGACLLVAHTEPDIAAVVCLSGMADPRVMMRRLLQAGGVPRAFRAPVLRVVEHLIGQRFRSFAPLQTLPQLSLPVLLLHGADDEVVPVAEARQLAAAAVNAQLVILSGAGHSDLAAVPLLTGTLRAFLSDPTRTGPPEPEMEQRTPTR